MKRFVCKLSSCVFAAMLLHVSVIAQAGTPGNPTCIPYSWTLFRDVPVGYWAVEYIAQISAAGITNGCGNERYCPKASVTRAQMAAFLVRAIDEVNLPAGCSGAPPFRDVARSSWACSYIERLSELQITDGCGGGNYCPESLVPRDQMAAFLVRAVDGEPPADYCGGVAPFADVPASSWACGYIKRLRELGITTGCGNGNYCPSELVNRAEMAAFIARAFQLDPVPTPEEHEGCSLSVQGVEISATWLGPGPFGGCALDVVVQNRTSSIKDLAIFWEAQDKSGEELSAFPTSFYLRPGRTGDELTWFQYRDDKYLDCDDIVFWDISSIIF